MNLGTHELILILLRTTGLLTLSVLSVRALLGRLRPAAPALWRIAVRFVVGLRTRPPDESAWAQEWSSLLSGFSARGSSLATSVRRLLQPRPASEPFSTRLSHTQERPLGHTCTTVPTKYTRTAAVPLFLAASQARRPLPRVAKSHSARHLGMISKLIDRRLHRLRGAVPGPYLGECGVIQVGDDGATRQTGCTRHADHHEEAQAEVDAYVGG
jgi:hypothetical protein